jgi:phospholipid/cholesterol/gamma-HCH transport system ATP-binding protein
MTTVINTHDMNSVMGIGDHVVFIHEGAKYWEGNHKEIMQINSGELFDFIFASDFLKDLRRKANIG